MVMKISTKGIKPKYVHWMSLQAKCHRCGCTQPPSTFGWWLVACKSKQGIWEKNFENFLFRIFKTRFQSFLKTFWCFEKLFLKILQILILSNGTHHTWGLRCGWQEIPSFKMFLDLLLVSLPHKLFGWFKFDIYNVPITFQPYGHTYLCLFSFK